MSIFDHRREGAVYHGGSFNGNPIGCIAGQIAVEDLTAEKIEIMDRHAVVFADRLRSSASDHGVPLLVTGTGSALGIYVVDPTDRKPSTPLTSYLHLAALNNGVYFGPGGEVAMATSMTDELLDEALEGLDAALDSLAPLISDWEST
jgi:glutamate-1-semialdehyde 2,1-aminomutase